MTTTTATMFSVSSWRSTVVTAACLLGGMGLTSGFTGTGWSIGRREHGLAAARQAARSPILGHRPASPLPTASSARRGRASSPLHMVATEPVLTHATCSKSASPRLGKVFNNVAHTKKAAFIPYLTAGYPKKTNTVDLLLALQEGGADVIELGVPFTDPYADGPTIQATNQVAMKNGVNLDDCLGYIRDARAKGLTVPVVLMGYLNPFLAYGLDNLVKKAQAAGADGFLVVDLPVDDAHDFVTKCRAHQLSFIPLVSPTTTDDRMPYVASAADSFIYCISVAGVTGVRPALPDNLKNLVGRVRAATDKPVSVGFGISSEANVKEVAAMADGVIVGSAFMKAIDKVSGASSSLEIATHLKHFTASLKAGVTSSEMFFEHTGEREMEYERKNVSRGYFGDYGGCYIPETLIEAHRELDEAYAAANADPAFNDEVAWYRRHYIGGPTPIYHAKRLSEEIGGAQIWLKREDLAHTGAHEINNAVGQALLAKRIGKSRIVAETGGGQHGVATATVCARLGMECVIYMGGTGCERHKLNMSRMKMLGAKVIGVESGSRSRKDAINEAVRDWVTNGVDTHYLVGSAIGPHPFPTIVRDFQSVVGKEARAQLLDLTGRLPEYVVACVGGGSNAIGMFHPFLPDVDAGKVKLAGVEAGGKGMDDSNAATLTMGTPGVLHGARTYLLQNSDGQIVETHSMSASLDYAGVGPEHSWLKDSGRAEYGAVTDVQALKAMQLLARTEGIISALESSHAVYHGIQMAKELPSDQIVLINLCGRGEKDMHMIAKYLGEDV